MILTKTPLRVSFVGGGSDRPWFANEEPGACVAAAIDRYVYVAVNDKYDGSVRAAYSITENVPSADHLQHELIREALKWFGHPGGVEIHSIADIPGGSGLGSSSSFTVGLLAALDRHYYANTPSARTNQWTAAIASEIEINRCRKPIGKQDQYTAAYGGVNLLGFTSEGVSVEPVACDMDALSAHCLLLDTGLARSGDAGAVLSAQRQDRDGVRLLAYLAGKFAETLRQNDLRKCGRFLCEAWAVKRNLVAIDEIDTWYGKAMRAGAWGGKLCGAGGGGFLLFLAPPERHQAITSALGLRHVPIRVGVPGCQVVFS